MPNCMITACLPSTEAVGSCYFCLVDIYRFKMEIFLPVLLTDLTSPSLTSPQSSLGNRLVHSHWSSSYITALSLVESFPNDACASSLMP